MTCTAWSLAPFCVWPQRPSSYHHFFFFLSETYCSQCYLASYQPFFWMHVCSPYMSANWNLSNWAHSSKACSSNHQSRGGKKQWRMARLIYSNCMIGRIKKGKTFHRDNPNFLNYALSIQASLYGGQCLEIIYVIKSGEVLILKNKNKKTKRLYNKYSKCFRLNKSRVQRALVGTVKILVGSKILCWLAVKNSYLLLCVAEGIFFSTIDLAHGYW